MPRGQVSPAIYFIFGVGVDRQTASTRAGATEWQGRGRSGRFHPSWRYWRRAALEADQRFSISYSSANNHSSANGGIHMRKSVYLSAAAAALLLAGAALLQLPGRDAAAQAGGVYINAVDLDINPADTAKFLEFVKENGAASVKEPGCREFNITVLAKDPNHVFLFEVYDNEAALNAHRTTDHFKKFAAATANMVTGRNVRALSPVAFNSKGH
jgi:autoinducer 2-degrading protein